MRPVNGFSLALLCLLPLALFGMASSDAHAQESSSSDPLVDELIIDESDESAEDLLTRIREDLEAKNTYQARLENASPEDSLVLRRQIATRQLRSFEDLHGLADVLIELENSEPQPELRQSVVAVFELLAPALRPFTDRLRFEINELRAQRAGTPAEARSALEDRIERRTEFLDEVYALWRDSLSKTEALGLDTAAVRAPLEASLIERADEVSGRVELALERVDEFTALINENPDDASLPLLVIASKKSLDTNTASLESALDLMDSLELPTSAYRTQLVSATRDISSGILDGGVAVSLVTQWVDSLKTWVVESGPKLLVKLLLFLIVLFAFRVLARLARKVVSRALASSKFQLSQLLTRMIINTAGNVVMFFGLMVALSQLGISLGPLMAGLGVVGFILGFALQDSLSNFAAGMMILLYRPYDVGDLVDISGVFGKVDKMSLVSTTILTLDHQTLVVPNSRIWGDVIKNVTAQSKRRVDMTFGISYSDDIPQAEGIFEDILTSHPKVLKDPEPMVRLHNLGESSVDFVVRPWVETDDYWDVYWDVTRAVKIRLDEAGVSIPFPQRDVHIYEEVLASRAGADPSTSIQDQTQSSSHTSHDSPSDDHSSS